MNCKSEPISADGKVDGSPSGVKSTKLQKAHEKVMRKTALARFEKVMQDLKETGCQRGFIADELEDDKTIFKTEEAMEDEEPSEEESFEIDEKVNEAHPSKPILSWGQLIAEALDEAPNKTLSFKGIL